MEQIARIKRNMEIHVQTMANVYQKNVLRRNACV